MITDLCQVQLAVRNDVITTHAAWATLVHHRRRVHGDYPYHFRAVYRLLVANAISVRLDDDAERALRILEATGLSLSAAIRSALLASAERVLG